MSNKKIKIKISPNGEIKMHTEGIKGKECEQYVKILGKLVDIKVTEKKYTEEYYEEEQNQVILEDNI